MIINLHGFGSTGNNNTYTHLSKYFKGELEVISPSYLVHHFSRGLQDIQSALVTGDVVDNEGELVTTQPLLFVGSSTGALYAEHLAKRYGGKTVLINPLVDPWLLRYKFGTNQNHNTGQEYVFTQAQLDTFSMLERDMSTPRLILVEKGDDVLDHRMTRKFYADCKNYYEFGGDSHRFTSWDEALPLIRKFYFSGAL